MIPWREKWRAFAIHFVVTLILAAGAAAIIFGVWFPTPFDKMVGGQELFLLVVGCDLVLGPLLSLVVYDSRKSRGKLVFDYCVVGIVQLAAMTYGVWIVASSRPVYVAFSGDRLQVVSAADILPKELDAARDPLYHGLPVTGPRLVAVIVPAKDHDDALFQALDGNEEPMRPKFYVTYESQLPKILKSARRLDELRARRKDADPKLAEARAKTGLPDEKLRYLPVRYHDAFWTALIDAESGRPLEYFEFDPY